MKITSKMKLISTMKTNLKRRQYQKYRWPQKWRRPLKRIQHSFCLYLGDYWPTFVHKSWNGHEIIVNMAGCKQDIDKSRKNNEQIINKSKFMKESIKSIDQVMRKSWISHRQVIDRSWTSGDCYFMSKPDESKKIMHKLWAIQVYLVIKKSLISRV